MLAQSRSSNILQHLASELRRAEAAGGLERLVSTGGGGGGGAYPGRRGSGGVAYPGNGGGGQSMRRRQSDPDLLAQMVSSGGSQRCDPFLLSFSCFHACISCPCTRPGWQYWGPWPAY